MDEALTTDDIGERICSLDAAFSIYQHAMARVLSAGDRAIPALLGRLNDKHQTHLVDALGQLMLASAEGARQAIPVLLDWLLLQSPLYSHVLDALRGVGGQLARSIDSKLEECAHRGDDEGVRNLLHLASTLPDDQRDLVMESVLRLFSSPNSQIRCAAAFGVEMIGLPQGRRAAARLSDLATGDPCDSVRDSAKEALLRIVGPYLA